MKKVKKNNKPLIILIVGFLIFGSLIGFSFYKSNQEKAFLIEDKAKFEKSIEKEKKDNEGNIASTKAKIESIKKEIAVVETEIDGLEKEITNLGRQKTDEFMNSRGFSDRYYALEDQINAKRKEISKKGDTILSKQREITTLESNIWKYEHKSFEKKYVPSKINGVPASLLLTLGIIGCVVTCFVALISKAIKVIGGTRGYSDYKEIDEVALSMININDGKTLTKEFNRKLETLLKASSEEDFDKIKKLCTKNMAKSYIDEINLLKKHNRKLVIKDVKVEESKIINAFTDCNRVMISVVSKVKLIQYSKDLTTNEIISGNEKEKQTQVFKLIFVKDFIEGHNITKCPNCGAQVKDGTKGSCDYCGTVFDNKNYDWYLEHKVYISE